MKPTKPSWVYVYDKDGNQYVCQMESVKDPKELTDDEKAGCADLSKAQFDHVG
jgi:hypothetical protein